MTEPDERAAREDQVVHDLAVANDAGDGKGRLHHREPHDDLTPNTEPEDEPAEDGEDGERSGLPREAPPL